MADKESAWRALHRVICALLAFVVCGCGRDAPPKGAIPQPADRGHFAMPTYPDADSWQHANTRQKERVKRSFAELKKRHVPPYHGPLLVDDDDEVQIQSAQDVARRTLVLWAVELRAEGAPQDEARGILDKMKLWDYVSPEEKRFLGEPHPSPEECRELVWRLESLWVLMWALGHLDELPWPSEMCDVKKLAGLLAEYEDDPKFITGAKLRPTAELLDAKDLILRIHWAIRNTDGVPLKLDWSKDEEVVPASESAGASVVQERHYVLNWLLKFMDNESWDRVDTPT